MWQARLEELGITHGEIVDAHYGSGLSFRDPDNIALELFAPLRIGQNESSTGRDRPARSVADVVGQVADAALRPQLGNGAV